MPDHVLGDRRLGDLEPELQQFTRLVRIASSLLADMIFGMDRGLSHALDEVGAG